MVDAPQLVSSDASPTRPEWAVTRASTPAARAAAANRSPTICGESGTTWSSGTGPAAARSVRRARATPVLHEPHVPRLTLLVRLAAAADGDEDPVAVGRVGAVGPADGAHLAPPHPGHEEQPRDHGVEPAALEGDLVGLDAAAATPRPVAGGEDGGQVRRPEPPPVAGEEPGGAFPGRARLMARRARKHAAATAVEALAGVRPRSWSSAR